ncbi:MAG TPA: stage III sporulation protein AH [Clostridiales bacterium]|nr:stage III sporulation protein AH [Clostridiales bacterium]
MKRAKRNVIIVTVLLFVCAAVYLNWTYNNRWGSADEAMVDAEDERMQQASAAEDGDAQMTVTSDYFAQARLTRQQARDGALALLEQAASSGTASQDTIDSAMDAIAVMATYSMQEAQIENLLIAKNFSDCVVYMSSDNVTVSVPAPVAGLNDADVAKIVDTITTETGYDATQIKVIEIKSTVSVPDAADTLLSDEAEGAETVG